MKRLLITTIICTPIIAMATNIPAQSQGKLQTNVLQELTAINQNLQSVRENQKNQSSLIKSNLNLQINRTAPATPFPNWAAVQSAQTNSMPQANVTPALPQSNAYTIKNTKMAQQLASHLIQKAQGDLNMGYHTQYDLANNIKPFVSANYTNDVNQATQLGTSRASNLLLLQDTKLLLALYQQQRTTQEILMAIALENNHHHSAGA